MATALDRLIAAQNDEQLVTLYVATIQQLRDMSAAFTQSTKRLREDTALLKEKVLNFMERSGMDCIECDGVDGSTPGAWFLRRVVRTGSAGTVTPKMLLNTLSGLTPKLFLDTYALITADVDARRVAYRKKHLAAVKKQIRAERTGEEVVPAGAGGPGGPRGSVRAMADAAERLGTSAIGSVSDIIAAGGKKRAAPAKRPVIRITDEEAAARIPPPPPSEVRWCGKNKKCPQRALPPLDRPMTVQEALAEVLYMVVKTTTKPKKPTLQMATLAGRQSKAIRKTSDMGPDRATTLARLEQYRDKVMQYAAAQRASLAKRQELRAQAEACKPRLMAYIAKREPTVQRLDRRLRMPSGECEFNVAKIQRRVRKPFGLWQTSTVVNDAVAKVCARVANANAPFETGMVSTLLSDAYMSAIVTSVLQSAATVMEREVSMVPSLSVRRKRPDGTVEDTDLAADDHAEDDDAEDGDGDDDDADE